MPINIQYGPISSALNLAQIAGTGQGVRQRNEDDLAFQQEVDRQKQEQNQAYATQIQQALTAHQYASENALHQQALTQQAQANQNTLGYKYDALGNRTDISQGNTAVRQQVADQQGQHVADVGNYLDAKTQSQSGKMDAGETYIRNSVPVGPNQENAVAYYKATGHIPANIAPQSAPKVSHLADDPQVQILKTELDHSKQDARDASTARQKYLQDQKGLIDPDDATYKDLQQKESAARQAYQQTFSQLRNRMMQVSQGSGQSAPAPSPAQAVGGGQVPSINSQQEFDQLPSGAMYIDAQTGQQARKP